MRLGPLPLFFFNAAAVLQQSHREREEKKHSASNAVGGASASDSSSPPASSSCAVSSSSSPSSSSSSAPHAAAAPSQASTVGGSGRARGGAGASRSALFLLLRAAEEQSRTSHGSRACVDACKLYAALVSAALRGVPKRAFLAPGWAFQMQATCQQRRSQQEAQPRSASAAAAGDREDDSKGTSSPNFDGAGSSCGSTAATPLGAPRQFDREFEGSDGDLNLELEDESDAWLEAFPSEREMDPAIASCARAEYLVGK